MRTQRRIDVVPARVSSGANAMEVADSVGTMPAKGGVQAGMESSAATKATMPGKGVPPFLSRLVRLEDSIDADIKVFPPLQHTLTEAALIRHADFLHHTS